MGNAAFRSPEWTSSDNDLLARVSAKAPDRLIPLGTTAPQLGKRAVVEVQRCAEKLGFKMLKFHPWLQGFSTAEPVFSEICGLAGELRLPIAFHDGTPCYSLSDQIGGLARRFPKTRFILGHSGLLWEWRSALEAARQPNVWLTLCGPHIRAIESLCKQGDPNRILWGSDFGSGMADQIEYRLNLFLRAALTDELKQRILEVNALNLLKP